MEEIIFETEQEAAVGLLFACALSGDRKMSQAQIEQLSRMMVMCSKFRGASLNDLSAKALTVQSKAGSRMMIEKAAPLISQDFRQTLFAMCCELMTQQGKIAEDDSEVLAMVALYLGLSIEDMRMMLATYLIRNRWNVEVIG